MKGQEIPLNPNIHLQLLHYLILNQSLFHHYLNPKRLKDIGKPKRAAKISQSSGPIPLVADETVIKEWEDKMERAVTTASSLEAKQDSGNINRTQSMATLNESFPQVTGSVLVYAARHSLIAVRHKLMLPGITYYCWFWATAKAKTVHREHQIQALVDKKKVIITEKSVRSDLMLDDAEGTECLPNDVIFEQLTLMSAKTTQLGMNLVALWHLLSYVLLQTKNSTFPIEGMTRHTEVYVTPSHTKKEFANMKRPGKGFSGRVTPLFPTMLVQALEDIGEDSAAHFDSHSTPIISQPSSSKPQRKKSRRKQRKDSDPIEPVTDEAHVSTPSYDLPQSDQAELIEEERLARQKEEEANIALIESWDNTQAMMEADFELAQRLQAEEQGEITIEERSR
ncbi:hypothetical protein Tco_0774480 [Tanacetum coccineum]|uniref:Uncharacterized protein n=1 Tax=Tanacetum coccineum TaxID=301880 RepID=A0ABQ4ZNP9_9ASTR